MSNGQDQVKKSINQEPTLKGPIGLSAITGLGTRKGQRSMMTAPIWLTGMMFK